MRPWQAAVLGGVQGVAEVVPVSSSAQLTLLPWLLGWEQPADRTMFGATLHAGSCLGICWALRDDLVRLDRRTVALIAASSLPAALAGALAADRVGQRLGRPPQLAALLAGAGLLLWAVDDWAERRQAGGVGGQPAGGVGDPPAPRLAPATVLPVRHLSPAVRHRSARTGHAGPPSVSQDSCRGGGTTPSCPAQGHPVGIRETALVAFAQVAALAPGVSRSGATLTALRAAGVDRAAAAQFSLLMSLPISAGAALLTLARSDLTTLRTAAPGLAAGATTAALAGAAAARWQSSRRPRGPTAAVVYRVGLAALVARHLRRRPGDGSRLRRAAAPSPRRLRR